MTPQRAVPRLNETGSAQVGSTWAARWCILAMILTVFSGHFRDMNIPLPLDRIAWVVDAVLVLLGNRASGRQLRIRPIHVVLGMSILLAFASAAGSGTLTRSFAAFALLDRVVMPAVAFMIAGLAISTEPDRALLCKSLVVLGGYLGITSVLSILGFGALVFPSYIMDPAVGIQFGRARGPFVESAANGVAMILSAMVAVAWSQMTRHRTWRIACWCVTALCLVACLLTYTRSVWTAAAGAVVVVFASERRLRRYILPAGLGTAVLLGTALLIPQVADAVFARSGEQRPLDDRLTTNAAALSMLERNPLTGIGWGRFLDVIDDSVRQLDLVPLTNTHLEAHNVLLARAAELGVPGALLWLATFALGPLAAGMATVRPELAPLRSAMRGVAFAFFYVAMFTPLPYPFVNIVTFALAGVVLVDQQTRRADGLGGSAAPGG